MRVSPQIFLAIALVGSLAVVYGSRPPEPERLTAPPRPGAVREPPPVALRILAKQSIVRAVIDGRLSLLEAAALWGEVNRLLPGGPGLAFQDEHHNPSRPPLRTDEERLCRRVIDWIETGPYAGSPSRAAEIVARLNAEFREWLRRGTNRLPDPSGLTPTATELVEQARARWARRVRKPVPAEQAAVVGGWLCRSDLIR